MNLFILDKDPVLAARYHCDAHLRKMIIEGIQMMATTWRLFQGTDVEILNPNTGRMRSVKLMPGESLYYAVVAGKNKLKINNPFTVLPSHENHPVTQWVRESRDNYLWQSVLVQAMHDEYIHRNGKEHQCFVNWYQNISQPPHELTAKGNTSLTPFYLMMPDEYKEADPVEAYRSFYRGDKVSFATWNVRGAPSWWEA